MSSAIEITKLDSGVTVVTERMADVLSVTTGVWVGVGSRDEVAEHAGASHFLEHLLFKGTEDRRATEIAEAIDSIGGEMNAFTTKEYTAFHTRTLATDLHVGLDLLCEIVSAPALRVDDVDMERQVILEEILMRGDEPSDYVHDVAHELAFGDHGLGRDTLGDEATIKATAAEDIRSFMDESYIGQTIVVSAAGNVRHTDVCERVSTKLLRSSGRGAPSRVSPSPPGGSVCAVRSEDTEQAHLVVGMHAIDRFDPDRYALSVVDHILGGGLSSRLFMEIREKRGLVYSVYSYRAAYQDAGFMGIYAGTAPSRAEEVLSLIEAELTKLGAGGILQSEIDRAKGSLRGGTALGLEDSGSRMGRIARGQLLHGEVLPIEEVLERTTAVTVADCQRAVDRLLASPRFLACVGPFEADTFADHPVLRPRTG